MKLLEGTFLLRFAVAVILLMHSILRMFDDGINNFGKLYLNKIGFSTLGVPIAWVTKLSHIICAFLLLANKWIKPAGFVTIVILIMGVILIHLKESWFVVGGGRNGIEYNFLLICVLLTIMYPKGFSKTNS